MTYYAKESIEKARQLDLLTYFQIYEPGELIKIGANRYRTRTHGSLELSNGKWMWWAQHIGGVSALDYLHKVEGIAFTEAVGMILRLERIPLVERQKNHLTEPAKREFALPPPCKNNDRVIQYLLKRGIDEEIISDCIAKGIIYEAEPYHNAIFVGFDGTGKAAYAAYRSIQRRILGEVGGSDKTWSFRLTGKDKNEVHVFESAIDVLSFLSIQKFAHKPWRDINCLSLGGVTTRKDGKLPSNLGTYLKVNQDVHTIVLHLDNDDAGRKCAAYLQKALKIDYEVRVEFPKNGKDVNDELRYRNKEEREGKQR